jgi:polyisoprenoid-binding protein YceI
MFKQIATAAAALLIAATAFAGETFTIDKTHSETSFRIRHLMSKTSGRFNDFDANLLLDRQKMENSKMAFTIQAASIDTANENRDKHLRSADFFDVEKHPTISFTSSSIKQTGPNKFDVTGTLTMRGVAKKVTLPVELLGYAKDQRGNDRVGFSTATTLNRKDYGIEWNRTIDAGGILLGDEVEVTINLSLAKKVEAAPAAAGSN